MRPGARFLPLPMAESKVRREPLVATGEEAPRVHIWQIGCQMNSADADSLAENFAEIGMIAGADLEDADLAVLVTCTVRQHAEDKANGKLGELAAWKVARGGRAIALTG